MSLFAGNQSYAGGFRADGLQLTFGGIDVRGYTVQSAQFNYTQQISLLYEVGSNYVYYVGGRAQGNASLNRVIGPAALGARLVAQFSDICNPQDITLTVAAGCKGGGTAYTMVDAVLVSLSVGVTAQSAMVNETVNFLFIDLE